MVNTYIWMFCVCSILTAFYFVVHINKFDYRYICCLYVGQIILTILHTYPSTCAFTYTETLISFTCLCTVNLFLYTIIRCEYFCGYMLFLNSVNINTLLFKRATSCTKFREDRNFNFFCILIFPETRTYSFSLFLF